MAPFWKPLELSTEERNAIRVNVADMARPKRSYFVLAILSTLIASFGLLGDSTAVVIGAMLVAPLMGPIFGIAMGLVSSSRRLLLAALVAEAAGVAVVVGLAFSVAMAAPMVELPGEVLSRTRPNTYDIIIAFASGHAGAFALVNKKINAALPGVAIATALVPPLASSGICWARGEAALGWGAFILFFVNLLAIELAAAGVFTLYGLNARRGGQGSTAFLRQNGWSLALLAVMGWFLTQSFVDQLRSAKLAADLQKLLSAEGALAIQGASLQGTPELRKSGERTVVFARYLTPRAFDEEAVQRIEERLRESADPRIDLVIRSLISTDRSWDGRVFETAEQSQEREAAAERQRNYQAVAEVIREELAAIPGADLAEIDMPSEAGGMSLLAVISAPRALPPQDILAIQRAVQDRTLRPCTGSRSAL